MTKFTKSDVAILSFGLLTAASSTALLETWASVVSCGLGAVMTSIAVVDGRRMVIPDRLSLPAIPAGLMIASLQSGDPFAQQGALTHLLAALAAAAVLYALRKAYVLARSVEGLGLGDVKLAAAAGAWNGFNGLGPTLLLASVSAIGFVLAQQWATRNKVDRMTPIPFGVFFAPSIWLVWIYLQIQS